MDGAGLRVLVVGGHGMLGTDLVSHLETLGFDVSAPSQAGLDVTVAAHLEAVRRKDYGDFSWVVNCAAYTAVDQAESEAMACMRLNAVAPGALAFVCRQAGLRFLHVSTDFVFDGRAESAYTEASATNPLSLYGKSKLQGEQNVAKENETALILRTSWLYGQHGKSFPRTIIEKFEAGDELRVVADQTGKPTSTKALAATIAQAIELGLSGLYHAAGPEAMSWHTFAVRTLECWVAATGQSKDVKVATVTSDEFPRPAVRPANSVLDTSRLEATGVAPMPSVDENLAEFCAGLLAEKRQG